MTNSEKYKKVFDVLISSEPISLEVDDMNKKRSMKYGIKKATAVAAVCFILVGAGTGVYAAAKYFGIIDFSNEAVKAVPEEAKDQIQTDIEMTKDNNDTIFDYSVKEALCDSESITLVYEVSAKEEGKYLFVPEDAILEDPMSDWSTVTGKTVQEYAQENHLTIVHIGGGITNTEELGISTTSMEFKSVRDDVMDVYIHSEVTQSSDVMDVDFVATGWESGSEEAMRLESSFTLQDASTTTTTGYVCTEDTSKDSFYHIEKAEVVQTDLGTYVDVYYTNDNGDNPEDGLTFRVVDQEGNELDSSGGSGIEWINENHYKTRCILSKCEIGDVLYIEAFDCLAKNVYGITELTMQKSE